MNGVFRRLSREQWNAMFVSLLCPDIEAVLRRRGPGHCMRVSDLDDDLLEPACAFLRKCRPQDNIYILGKQEQEGLPFRITSTKLVELRNPDASGNLRPPLLVFIPNALRTSAEDSFGAATFEELAFPTIYEELIDKLLTELLPRALVGQIREILRIIKEKKWPFADEVAQARYLLTTLENDADVEHLGVSLYELGLIPDFKLFADPDLVSLRVQRNLDCVEHLIHSHKTIRGRVSDLKLADKELEERLCSFFERHDAQKPPQWTPSIAHDPGFWNLSFDRWSFQEEPVCEQMRVTVLGCDLPLVPDTETDGDLVDLIGQQVLNPKVCRKTAVDFEVDPHPGTIADLDFFSVQIIAQNGGPVGKAKKVKPWKRKTLKKSVNLDKLDTIAFEEGWHFIRVTPWTAQGDPVPMPGPLETESGLEGGRRPNESEPFYVLHDGAAEQTPTPRTMPGAVSLEHRRLHLRLKAINEDRDPDAVAVSGCSWEEKGRVKKNARLESLLVKFGGEGMARITVSRLLRDMERRILAEPDHPAGRRIRMAADAVDKTQGLSLTATALPASSAMTDFLAARREFFAAVRRGEADLIMQGLAFREVEESCLAYAQSYEALVHRLVRQAEASSGIERQKRLRALKTILTVDAVQVVLSDFRGRRREAMLLSPTHPLRALWLCGWAVLADRWIDAVKAAGKEYVPHVRALESLTPVACPVGIPADDGRIFTPVDNLNPFWALYAPTTEENPRGLMAEIRAVLGLAEPAAPGADISGQVIANRMERYLLQHPYVRELSINVFNPGAGSMIAQALRDLQQKGPHADLRYDVRLFTADPDSPVLGEDLELMARPAGRDDDLADAFAASTGSHLFSKLKLAKYRLEDFRADPGRHQAHISMLLDMFPPHNLTAAEKKPGAAALHGLIQDFETEFVDDRSGTFWSKWPVVASPRPPTGDRRSLCFEVLPALSRRLCFAVSAVALSGAGFRSVPVVTLSLDAGRRALLHTVHQTSDWVFTIDRNMGIEFYDHGGRRDRPDYLIDHVPGAHAQATHNLIVSSQSHEELEAMLRPVLADHKLSADSKQAARILASLRSLSGQLALKLISAKAQQTEALGLALARLYLEYQGALRNQIIVPLDAHTDLYHAGGRETPDEAVSLRRTDLALFDPDLGRRTMTCNLVEVKCHAEVGGPGAFNTLKAEIAEQIATSERVLQRHFDPALKMPDRPDRPLKSRELATLLRFYLDRSLRYGIFDPGAAQEARAFLESIEDGYSLQFRRCALIFDFAKRGAEVSGLESGIEFHRIGRDLIQDLLAHRGGTEEPSAETASSAATFAEQRIPSVPKLREAAFIAPPRERTRSWAVDETPLRHDADADPEPAPEEPRQVRPLSDEATGGEGEPGEDTASGPENGIPEEASATPLPVTAPLPAEAETAAFPQAPHEAPAYDILLGVDSDASPQFGLLGKTASDKKVALDLNGTHTMSLFGVQGGGKSYTLGTVIEMATMPIPHINALPNPLATVIFHYSSTQDYAPEFTSMAHANAVDREIRLLADEYRAEPRALRKILLLTPASKVRERRQEYPNIEVHPLSFAAGELKAANWKFLMGAVGAQNMYLRQINQIMRNLRGNITLEALRAGIAQSALSDQLKNLANIRLNFAAEYINEKQKIQDLVQPGCLILVDLRDELIEKDEALGLFVVMLQIFSEATCHGKPFNKLVVFDEAHKYMENDDLVDGLIETVREMRHKGTSIMIASQDPPSVPAELIALSTQIIMHKFNSPTWLKHIQKANTSLAQLTPTQMSQLGSGEAYVWSNRASDKSFTNAVVKIRCRPRVTQHGGATKTAVAADAVR